MEKKKNPRGRKESNPAVDPKESLPGLDPRATVPAPPAIPPAAIRLGLAPAEEEKLLLPPEDLPVEAALPAAPPQPPKAAAGNTIAELLFERAEREALEEAASVTEPAPLPAAPMTPAPAVKPQVQAAPAVSATPVQPPAPQPPRPAPAPAAPRPAPAVPAPVAESFAAAPPDRREAPQTPAGSPAAAPVRALPVRSRSFAWLLPALLGLAAGLLLAGLGWGLWTAYGPHQKEAAKREALHADEIKKLQAELETVRFESSNLRTGSRNLSVLLNAFSTDWDKPPEKPRYLKTPDGILIFWEDQMIWRKYYLYQGKGDRGRLMRYNPRPLKRPFVYLANPAPGLWRFSISALNKEGKETLPGEVLSIRLPLD